LKLATTGTLALAAVAITAVAAPPAAHAYGYYYYHRYHGYYHHPFRHHGFRAPSPDAGRVPDKPDVVHGRTTLATRTSPSFAHLGFGRDGFGLAHADGQFHRFGVFGWVGPLFWPYAWNDINCSVFWSYWGYGCGDSHWSAGYGDPFWDYGSADIAAAVFTPFTFDDLAPYLPNGVASVRRARTKEAPAGDLVAQMCGDDARGIAGWPVERIAAVLTLDDRQHAALEDLAKAAIAAAETIRGGCPVGVAFPPGRRLEHMIRRIEVMQEAVAAVRPALSGFYDSLSDQQKDSFVAAAPPEHSDPGSEAAAACSAASTAAPWPEARIAAVLKPVSAAQEARLRALQDAMAGAASVLAASCPAQDPATPPARLNAVAVRLDALHTAVTTVRAVLEDLYSDLSDAQKARFNRIGQPGPA